MTQAASRHMYRVFISSTDLDLHEHRTALIDTIMRIQDAYPIDMRYFGAQAEGTATTVSMDRVREARGALRKPDASRNKR